MGYVPNPRKGPRRVTEILACEHGMEVGAAGRQHHFVGLDLLGGHMQDDVAEQASLPHAVHADKGIVIVPLGVVGDAVAIPVQELHATLHGCRGVVPGSWHWQGPLCLAAQTTPSPHIRTQKRREEITKC